MGNPLPVKTELSDNVFKNKQAGVYGSWTTTQVGESPSPSPSTNSIIWDIGSKRQAVPVRVNWDHGPIITSNTRAATLSPPRHPAPQHGICVFLS